MSAVAGAVVVNDMDVSVSKARGVEVDHDGAVILAENITVRLDAAIVDRLVAERTALHTEAAS